MSRLLPLLLVLSATLALADVQAPNLVQNPGFEALGDNGVPVAWPADMKVFTPVTSPVHSGEQALQYVNDDPQRYVLFGQGLPLQVGSGYEVSVWIKTEDIKGEDSGATICLEWTDADGGYVGGFYPAGFKGTNDWQQLRAICGRIPKNAAHCTVTCYVRKGMTGKAWWDDVEVRKWRSPALATTLLAPNYRGEILPGRRTVEVAADLELEDYGLKVDEVALRTQIVRMSDLRVMQSKLWRPAGNEVRLSLPVQGLEPGKYEVRTSVLRASNGAELGSDAWRLQVLTPAQAAQRLSFIDEHNRLIRDGKPFFPLGMYWGGINEADLKTYADSAFNCLMPYGAPDKAQLDLAQKLGLKVIYSVKDIYYGSAYCPADVKTTEDERKFITAKAEAFRSHPALLAWYLNDELSVEYIPRLEGHQAWMEELDPDHPTWIVLYQVGQLEQYRKTYDVLGTDPYPIPEAAARRAADYTKQSVESAKGCRPVWMVPQVMNWAVYRKPDEDKQGLRPPTLDEMRSMAWQCITEGAQGLIFYSFFDLKRDTIVPFDRQWPLVKQMAAEIKALEPVILSVEPTPTVKIGKYTWLHWTVRRVGRTVYLIAVNDDERPHSVRFDLGFAPLSVRLRGSAAPVRMHAGDRLEAEFNPFGVNVYEVGF